MAQILVTGGSGFVASHVIQQALAAGHAVRTTLRDPAKLDELKGHLAAAAAPTDKLTAVRADLTADAGWAEAVAGCDYVLHVASPFVAVSPKDENDLITPAREGSLRVLRAAKAAGVKRVVLTSSIVAISAGHPAREAPFTEADWTVPNGPGSSAYARSKTFAERAAWDYVEGEGKGLELAVINPGAIFGPLITPQISTSVLIVKQMLEGAMPALPRLALNLVDVRDVASLHLLAMTAPAAAGQRHICVTGDPLWMAEVAQILKDRGGPRAAKVSTKAAPDWLLRLMGKFTPALKDVVHDIGKFNRLDNARARALGWTPRSAKEATIAAADSLETLGVLKAA